jgi:MFS transporter, ACS family, tartrate transporter
MSGYFAPQFTGLLHDATGGYKVPLLVAGCLGLAAPVLIVLSGIRRYVARPAR